MIASEKMFYNHILRLLSHFQLYLNKCTDQISLCHVSLLNLRNPHMIQEVSHELSQGL
ncbi:hypothetical protein Hanom_Chr08g00742661 [Helianthus anomalus]